MFGLKSMSVTSALLLSLAAFAFSANTAAAVDVPGGARSIRVHSAMSEVLSSAAVKSVMVARRDRVVPEKVYSKPLINDFMPKIESIMMPVVKEKILPGKMIGLQNEMAQRIAPQF